MSDLWTEDQHLASVQAKSRPMNAIVERMLAFGEFEIFVFGDDCILNKPISEWPTCECLLSWHSDGFPLIKAPPFHDPHYPETDLRPLSRAHDMELLGQCRSNTVQIHIVMGTNPQ